jgi:hypothetical protein
MYLAREMASVRVFALWEEDGLSEMFVWRRHTPQGMNIAEKLQLGALGQHHRLTMHEASYQKHEAVVSSTYLV